MSRLLMMVMMVFFASLALLLPRSTRGQSLDTTATQTVTPDRMHPGGGGYHTGSGRGDRGFGRGGGWMYPHNGRGYPGWRWNYGWQPYWWNTQLELPIFQWRTDIPVGYWQCTAFNQNLMAYSGYGVDIGFAANAALYSCGGVEYQYFGCYVPPNYCVLR